jgi:alanyl-tRNA synthetase
MVSRMIRENHAGNVAVVGMEEAKSMGAMALFGEKYGDQVRVVRFGKSVELWGGTHVEATGTIGLLKIVSEGAIASGVRRIEAVTASKAEEYINEKLKTNEEIATLLKSTGNLTESIEKLLSDNNSLRKSVEKFQVQSVTAQLRELFEKGISVNNIKFVSGEVEAESSDILKNIAYQIRTSSAATILVIGSENAGKANILVAVSDDLVNNRKISAVNIIREISGEINGGGGGQPFLATAGGKNPEGIPRALAKAEEYVRKV